MDRDKVREVLLYLEDAGWSDLIDSRWKNDLVNEITEKFPNLENEVLEDIDLTKEINEKSEVMAFQLLWDINDWRIISSK